MSAADEARHEITKTFSDTFEKLEAVQAELIGLSLVKACGREVSLVRTKLQEAGMWLDEARSQAILAGVCS